MTKNRILTVAVVAAMIAAIIGGIVIFRKTENPAHVAVQHKVTPPPASPKAAPQKADINNDLWEVALVHHAEGPQHPIIRHLIAAPKEWDFAGDVADARAVKEWAGTEAHRLAEDAGIVDWKFGREMRVRKADTVAFFLERDEHGNKRIVQRIMGEKGDGEPGAVMAAAQQAPPSAVYLIAKDVSGSTFVADTGHFDRSYLYVYGGEA